MKRNWTVPAALILAGFMCLPRPGVAAAAKEKGPVMTKRERLIQDNLARHVRMLSDQIGDRRTARYAQLRQAELYITGQMQTVGLRLETQEYIAGGFAVRNLFARIPGTDGYLPKWIVGAHYDTCDNPGADDNASAVAGLIEAARLLVREKLRRSLEIVFFVNEEPPYFQTREMGSRVYLERAKENGKRIEGAIILEMIGYFDPKPGSQKYPVPLGRFLPDTGDFLAVVGNFQSRPLAETFARGFREGTDLKVIPFAEDLPWIEELTWSDHASFWREKIPAVMLTDTSFHRNPNYHTGRDTWDTLDYNSLRRAVLGLAAAIRTVCNEM